VIPLAFLGAVLMAITVAVQLGVTRMGVSLKKLAPDFKRLNPSDQAEANCRSRTCRRCCRP
jgi:flagellar biosynthesis protein FlhB